MKKTRREIKKQEKIKLQNYGNGLRIYTGLRVQQSWQEVTDEIKERLDLEFEWFGRNGLAKGMLMLKGCCKGKTWNPYTADRRISCWKRRSLLPWNDRTGSDCRRAEVGRILRRF